MQKGKNTSKLWLAGWLFIVVVLFLLFGVWVYYVDPYFHFHKPKTSKFFYVLNNERSQNDGITKHFEYDAIITGTSMTQNFRTTEIDELFNCTSVKLPYVGATYKEINDNLKVATDCNPELKLIIRGLDMGKFMDKKDKMSDELGEYPKYLYDKNLLNDVQYVLNREVIWNRVYVMTVTNKEKGIEPGITPFDEYSKQTSYPFGRNAVCPNGIGKVVPGEAIHLTDKKKEIVEENIDQNVVSIAVDNPDIEFYYFITPYSAVYWGEQVATGAIYRQIEAEEYAIEQMLECKNIKLYSFNNRLDITCDLNNYRDEAHYGEWVNSFILQAMHDGEGLLTRENYKRYLEDELNNYLTLDYSLLNNQEDYDKDLCAVDNLLN